MKSPLPPMGYRGIRVAGVGVCRYANPTTHPAMQAGMSSKVRVVGFPGEARLTVAVCTSCFSDIHIT